MKNFWEKTFGAKRRLSDRKLLALLEKEIADEEKRRAAPAQPDKAERERICRAFGRPLT